MTRGQHLGHRQFQLECKEAEQGHLLSMIN